MSLKEYYTQYLTKTVEKTTKDDKSNSAIFVAQNRMIDDIIYDHEFRSTTWTHQKYNILSSNLDLITFIDKLVEFIKEFDLPDLSNKEENKLSPLILFKDLFKDNESYGKVIKQLTDERIIKVIENNSMAWQHFNLETPLEPKKSLCVLALVLIKKNYLKNYLKNNIICQALNNTFNVKVSEQSFGQIKKEFYNSSSTSKILEYIASYNFIDIL